MDWGRGGAGKVRKRLPSWNAFSCDLEKAECSDLQASLVKHMVSCHLTDQYNVPAPACVPVCSVVFKVVMTDTLKETSVSVPTLASSLAMADPCDQ